MYEDFDENILNLIKSEEEGQTYPLDICIKEAYGCYIVDENNNKYIDLTSNLENQPLGYTINFPIQGNYFFESELFNSSASKKLSDLLVQFTGLKKAIFTSSKRQSYGIVELLVNEYLETSIKSKVVSATLSSNIKNFDFGENIVDLVPLNNETVFKSIFTKSVGAVIIDIAQIIDDITIVNQEYLAFVRNLCNKNDAILVLDASSLSPFRLGTDLFNYNISIKPDILILPQGLSQGIPFGGIVLSEKLNNIKLDNIKTSTSTLALSLISKFLEDCKQEDFQKIVSSNSRYFEKSLEEMNKNHISVIDFSSYGFLYTMTVDISAYDLVEYCLKNGVILESLNNKTIKLSPPYAIGKEEIDRVIHIFDSAFDHLAKFDRLL